LAQELTLSVNVGMGATDPMQKLQKFISVFGAYTQMLQNPVPGVDMQEVGKELFGHAGYSDGSRFFTNDNPQILAMQAQLQKVMAELQETQKKLKDKTEVNQTKYAISQDNNKVKMAVAKLQEEAANKRALAAHFAQLSGAQLNEANVRRIPSKPKAA
jgi:hypothetical protein